jgi:hypothetical protein
MVEVSHYEECPFCRGFHWHKFQSLESKLVDISSHVSLDERNFKAWGESIADLLVLTGNAMDTFFRDMKDCPNFTFDEDLARIERRELNVKHYREIFEHYYELSKNQVTLQFELGEPIQITPFKDFSESTPDWWSAYNTTKHQFYDKMYDANLENTISCMG